eukprot:TRINITY_DN4259_c0_g1_i1.p1 TRINITY_DN4259_c0_g1~~TRINITY_DN4259_c0_g1_i1.p1  ORF type:complete len:472 (-),score=112.63 TRINITY_DN4259_c0_g1_i1:8-1423(-)
MKSSLLFSLTLFLSLFSITHSKSASEWRNRSVYQLLTDRFARNSTDGYICKDWNDYCGGTWKGIQRNLDYIQGMGFDAIWISPIPKNFQKGYHGYWADDFSKLNAKFGTAQDLKDLVDECHRRNVWVMVDVVANHVYSDKIELIVPFNKEEHYHRCDGCPKFCTIENWSNQWEVETCRLTGMPDLNQTVPFVSKYLNNWVSNIIKTYKFDAIRIDTLPLVSKNFWRDFAKSSGVFSIGEALDARLDFVGGYQSPKGPIDSVLSYPNYFVMKEVFGYKSKNMRDLANVIKGYKYWLGNVDYVGTFMDCHDQPRFRSYNNDLVAQKSALVYTMLSFGIPMVYYGTEQQLSGGNDPDNREPLWHRGYNTQNELYKFLTILNKVRKDYQVWNFPQTENWVDDQIYVFSRGNVLIATTNVGTGGPQISRTITNHPFKDGQTVCNAIWGQSDCQKITGRNLQIVLNNGESKVFIPKK